MSRREQSEEPQRPVRPSGAAASEFALPPEQHLEVACCTAATFREYFCDLKRTERYESERR